MPIELVTGKDDNGRRLDRILRKTFPDTSLSLLHRLLRQGKVTVNKKRENNPSAKVNQNSIIEIYADLIVNRENGKVNNNTMKKIPEIIWYGAGLAIFNKPAGIASHGPDSLDKILFEAHFFEKLPVSLSFKPGPLHRLDKPTSGLIAFSLTLEGAIKFSRLLHDHKIIKTYLAIVDGCITKEAIWQDTLIRNKSEKKTIIKKAGMRSKNSNDKTSKFAITTIRPLAGNKNHTLIEAKIKTGRTHQIRAQAAAHGYPLSGDMKYNNNTHYPGYFLHAYKMEFTEIPEGFPSVVIAPLPQAFRNQIKTLQLFGNYSF